MISSLGKNKKFRSSPVLALLSDMSELLSALPCIHFVGEKDYYRAFIPSALLFFLFSFPLFFFVKEEAGKAATLKRKTGIFAGYRDIYATFKKSKSIKTFLLSWLLIYF
jgi:MFS transporter, UMF1 family